MRRFSFSAIIIVFFILCGAVFHLGPGRKASSHEDPYLILGRTMQLADAAVTTGELHYWASLGACPEITSLTALENRADELWSSITCGEPLQANPKSQDLPAAATFTAAQTDFSYAPSDQQQGKGAETKIPVGKGGGRPAYMLVERQRELCSGGRLRLLLQHREQEGKKVVHLLITVTEEGETPLLGSIATRLPALLRSEVEEENLSLCLTGRLDGRLGLEEMEELARAVAKEVGGGELQSITDGQMVSVTAYAPGLGGHLQAGDLRVNLNLALRYDHYLQKTVLWAGTPLIPRPY